MANKRKKVEFVRAITGPSIESKNEELPRYSTWSFGEGITVNPSPYFQKHEIEIDEAYVVDLINQHGGGGGGNPSAWAFYSASHNVDMDEKRITNLGDPTDAADAATKGYVDSHSGGGGDSSLLTSNDANTFITASNDSLITGFDQYSKKLTVEELDPEAPGLMLSKSIETWDDIASDQTIWGSADGFGKAFMRTNYAFVEDSNNKSWGFQWINNVFEGHSHQGINISQGDSRITFATVDTSSGDFYLGSETSAENYWSQLDIRKNNIEIRASKDYNEISFKIEPSGAFINKPLDMDNNRITNVEDPMFFQDVATKAYVDGIAGLAASTFEGELPLSRDSVNDTNVSAASAGPLRYTRIGRTVTLSGTVNVTADNAGATTAAFNGITGSALPVTNNTWRSIILDTSSHITKPLNVMVYPSGDFRFTVVGAEAGASYRISFVMTYRSVV